MSRLYASVVILIEQRHDYHDKNRRFSYRKIIINERISRKMHYVLVLGMWILYIRNSIDRDVTMSKHWKGSLSRADTTLSTIGTNFQNFDDIVSPIRNYYLVVPSTRIKDANCNADIT